MDKERAGIQSVEVGFALLEGLTRSRGPLMLKDVAASAGMSAAKAHRYLVSFQRLGLVTQDPRTARYDLGPAALKLGLASLTRLDGVRLARERMPALMETIGHTLALAVWGNHGPTIVHWEESPQAVTANLRLGDVMPLLSSATGRCFAAFMSPEVVAPLLKEELARAVKMRRTDLPATMAEVNTLLAEVRERGAARGADFQPLQLQALRQRRRHRRRHAAASADAGWRRRAAVVRAEQLDCPPPSGAGAGGAGSGPEAREE